MDGTATINAKVDSLRLCGFVQNLGCAKPRLWKYSNWRLLKIECVRGRTLDNLRA